VRNSVAPIWGISPADLLYTPSPGNWIGVRVRAGLRYRCQDRPLFFGHDHRLLRIAMRAAIDAPLRAIADCRLDIGQVHRAVANRAGGQKKRVDLRGRRAIHVHDNFVLQIESYVSH
jgi:hypothetical protein